MRRGMFRKGSRGTPCDGMRWAGLAGLGSWEEKLKRRMQSCGRYVPCAPPPPSTLTPPTCLPLSNMEEIF